MLTLFAGIQKTFPQKGKKKKEKVVSELVIMQVPVVSFDDIFS